MNGLSTLEEIITMAIAEGIYTTEDLRKSNFVTDYWIASETVAKSLDNLYYTRTEAPKAVKGWADEDVISEFRDHLVKKYEKIAQKIVNPEPNKDGLIEEFSYNGYITEMFTNFLNSTLRKPEIKITVVQVDENNKKKFVTKALTKTDVYGKEKKQHYKFESLFKPTSDEDESLCLGDTLISDIGLPEQNCIEKLTLNRRKFDRLQLVSKHTYLCQMYVYIEDCLDEEGYPSTMETSMAYYQYLMDTEGGLNEEFKKYFVDAYNHDFMIFMKCFSDGTKNASSVRFIKEHFANDFSDFGRNFDLSSNRIQHLRNYNKKEITDDIRAHYSSLAEYNASR